MNRWDELIDECYIEMEENEEPMSIQEQEALLQAVLKKFPIKGKRKNMNRKKFILAVVAAAGLTVLSAGAAQLFQLDTRVKELLHPTNEGHIEQIQNTATALEQTVTDNGWTMDFQGVFGDGHSAYIVFDMIAPEKTVLDGLAYRFEQPFVSFEKSGALGYSCDTLEDIDKTDNQITFILQINSDHNLSGQKIELNFQNIQEVTNEPVTIAEGHWSTELTLNYQNISQQLAANKEITMQGETVKVTNIEISPLSVTVEMKGELFSRLDKEPPEDGIMPQADIILYFNNGNTLYYTTQEGDDMRQASTSQNGNQFLQTVSFQQMIDLDKLQSIEINGILFSYQ